MRYHSFYRKTLRILFPIFLFCLTNLSVNPIMAHSPSNILLVYNKDSSSLQITVDHTVSDPTTHYIESLSININGSNYDTINFESQNSSSSLIYNYPLSVAEGTTISVTAICNLSGEILGSITVDIHEPNNSEESTIPGFSVILIIIIMLSSSFGIIFSTQKFRK